MTTYISMLRGINVSGHKRMSMSRLAALYESLGLKNPRTYVQSGNVVFESGLEDTAALRRLIEGAIEKEFGFSAAVLIRTKDELSRVVETNPFIGQEEVDIERLYVTFLSDDPEQSALDRVREVTDPSDRLAVAGGQVYLFCPNGYGKTKLSNEFFEKKLKVTATTRNWKTVTSLLRMAGH